MAGPGDLGAYLEDGQRLYQVVRADPANGTVLLEDAGDPSQPLTERKVAELASDGFRVVMVSR